MLPPELQSHESELLDLEWWETVWGTDKPKDQLGRAEDDGSSEEIRKCPHSG